MALGLVEYRLHLFFDLTPAGFIGFLAAKLGAENVKLYEADKEVFPPQKLRSSLMSRFRSRS